MRRAERLDGGRNASPVLAELTTRGADAAGRLTEIGVRIATRSRSWQRAASRVAAGSAGAFALAGLSGLLYAAGTPPLSLAVVEWVAVAPLFVAVARLSPLRAAAAGMVWSATMVAGVAFYLPGMLSAYFGMAGVASWIGAVAFGIGLVGVYVSAYAAWVAWVVRRGGASPLLLAGGWVVCEFARAHGVVANPWALSAYSQMHATALIQIADATGPYGLGFLIGAVNASVAAALAPALRGRHPAWSVSVIAAALIGVLLYGHWRLGQTFADGAPLSIAIVQGGTPPSPPQHPEQRAPRLQRYITLTESVAARRPALIVWPEYAVESYLQEATPAREAVLGVAASAGTDLVLGGPHYVRTPAGTRYHNSVFLIRDGRLAARYDKNRLVPFGEDTRLEWLLGHKLVSYTAGSGGFVLPASALQVGAFVCVESMYPELVREVTRQGAEVLVNLSNDYWFGYAASARHQLDIAALRAVENRRYLVRATPTGFSAVVDPYGRTIVQSEFVTPEVLIASVRAAHVRTPYQRWGDAFAVVVMASVAIASIRFFRKGSRVQAFKGPSLPDLVTASRLNP